MFSTQWSSSVFLITFQNYSDSRSWLRTSDSDCYKLNRIGGANYHLSIIHYMLGSNKLQITEP